MTSTDPPPRMATSALSPEAKDLLHAHDASFWLAARTAPLELLLERFAAAPPGLDDGSYWRRLGWAWVMDEEPRDRLDTWRELLASERPNREEIMLPQERQLLASLPSVVHVFRGVRHGAAATGIGWTTDLLVAVGHAVWIPEQRDAGEALLIAHALVPRERIVAAFARNDSVDLLIPDLGDVVPRVIAAMSRGELDAARHAIESGEWDLALVCERVAEALELEKGEI